MNVPSISDLTTNLVPAVKAIIKFIGFVFVCVFMTSYFEYLKNFYSIKDIYKNTYTDENGVKVCNKFIKCSIIGFYNNLMDNIIGLKEILIMINKLYYFGIFYYIFSVVIMILLVVGIFFVIYVLTFGIICYSPFFQSILGTYYKSIVVFFINMFVFGLIPSITTIYYLFWFPISKSNLAEELPQLLFIKNVKKDGFKIFLAILLGISYICITLLNYWISIVFLGPIFLVLLSQRSFYSNIYQSLFHFSSQSQPPQLQPQQIATNQYSQ